MIGVTDVTHVNNSTTINTGDIVIHRAAKQLGSGFHFFVLEGGSQVHIVR